jgi:hypothetical protein
MATSVVREVFVLENNGVPTRVELPDYDGAGQLAIAAEAGVRLGLPVGQERVVRYVPEHANLWLFQANENWTETQLTNTGPVQPLLQQAVDGEPWTFSLYFVAPDWDAAKRLMDVMQGHRVGSYVEHTVPEPKTLKERRLTVVRAGHKFKSGKKYVNHCAKCGLERGMYKSGNYQYLVDGKWQPQVPMCPGTRTP